MWTYYRDVTLYALTICLLFGIASAPVRESVAGGIITTLVVFAVFGTGLGVLGFHYFQKQQYYMYYNLGYTKRYLISRVWFINFTLGCFFALLLSPFI